MDDLKDQFCILARLAKTGGLAGLILVGVAALPVPPPLRGSVPYLPAIGPAPLRFATTPAPGAAEAWKAMLLAKKNLANQGTNTTNPVVAASPSPASTNAITVPPTLVAQSAPTNSDVVPEPEMFSSSWDDSFDPATPQTWIDLFKPNTGGKFSGPRTEQPRFVPPAPKPADTSQAIEKSK